MTRAMLRLGRLAALFGLGALIGTAADQIHVRAGVLSYPVASPLLPGQPSWVPLLFGAAGVALPLGNAAALHVARRRALPASARVVVSGVLWFFAAYASTALFQSAPVLLTMALVLVWGARVAVRPTLDKLLVGPIFGLGGALFEAGLSSTGAFRYQHPDVLLVPAWLPALYLHASLMTRAAWLALLHRAPAGAPPASPPR